MKITSAQLKRIIKEEISKVQEAGASAAEHQLELEADDTTQLIDSISMMTSAGMDSSEVAMVVKGILDAGKHFSGKTASRAAILDALDVVDFAGPAADLIVSALLGRKM